MKAVKGKVSQTTTHSKEYKIVTNPKICEPYWDEGRRYHRPKEWKKKRKQILRYQVRLYRSWKHNRKTKWK